MGTVTTERQIADLVRHPDKAQAIARSLLVIDHNVSNDTWEVAWSMWEHDFLDRMADTHSVSHRQAEKLLDIQNSAYRYKTMDGFSVRPIVDDILLGRDVFDEDQDELLRFVERLKHIGYPPLTMRQWRLLFRCARITGTIESHAGVE